VGAGPGATTRAAATSPGLVPIGDWRKNSPRMAAPPTAWLTPRNFSAANLRSANWVLKSIATSAPMLNAPKISAFCKPVNLRLGM
jgi:hypothetical protein